MTILIILLMEKSLWKKQLVLSKDLEDLQLHQVVVPTQIKVFWTGTEKLLNHPLKSSKRPTAIPKKPKEDLTPKSYHFYMKLKLETVPTWDGNKNTLTRWIEKVRQLANTSPDIFKELGKVVPQRFTNSAETWYHSIPSKDQQPMEHDWSMLKTAIVDYHNWLKDQKFCANNAQY
jgi:hypothetical protein